MTGLHLDLTGEMSIVIGLEHYGPIHFRVNDLELVKTVLRCLLDDPSAQTMSVNQQTSAETTRLKRMLKGP